MAMMNSSADDAVVRSRLILDTRQQLRFFKGLKIYRDSGKRDDLRQLLIEIYQMETSILKSYLQYEANKREVALYRAKKDIIASEMNSVMEDLKRLNRVFNDEKAELKSRLRYSPLVKEMKIYSSYKKMEQAVEKLQTRIETLQKEKANVETVKLNSLNQLNELYASIQKIEKEISDVFNLDTAIKDDENASPSLNT